MLGVLLLCVVVEQRCPDAPPWQEMSLAVLLGSERREWHRYEYLINSADRPSYVVRYPKEAHFFGGEKALCTLPYPCGHFLPNATLPDRI
jgi:hypothetical protein